MVAGRNIMSPLFYPPPLPSKIFPLGLEPAHLLPYYKYSHQNDDRVVDFPILFDKILLVLCLVN